MIDTPEVTTADARPAAVLYAKVPREQIREVMGPGIQEVMAVVRKQGIGPDGPWFTHHLRMDPGFFEFEIGVPVRRAVTPERRVKAGELPGGKVARTTYAGPYEGLSDAWRSFQSWIGENGLKTGPEFWECYVVGPEAGEDPSVWRTELNQTLAG